MRYCVGDISLILPGPVPDELDASASWMCCRGLLSSWRTGHWHSRVSVLGGRVCDGEIAGRQRLCAVRQIWITGTVYIYLLLAHHWSGWASHPGGLTGLVRLHCGSSLDRWTACWSQRRQPHRMTERECRWIPRHQQRRRRESIEFVTYDPGLWMSIRVRCVDRTGKCETRGCSRTCPTEQECTRRR